LGAPYSIFGSGLTGPNRGDISIVSSPSTIEITSQPPSSYTVIDGRGCNRAGGIGMYCGDADVQYGTSIATPQTISALFKPGPPREGLTPGVFMEMNSNNTFLTYEIGFTGDEFEFIVSDDDGSTTITTIGVDVADQVDDPMPTYHIMVGYNAGPGDVGSNKEDFMRIYVNGVRYATSVSGSSTIASAGVFSGTKPALVDIRQTDITDEDGSCVGYVDIEASTIRNDKVWNRWNQYLRWSTPGTNSVGSTGGLCGSPSYFYYVSGITHVPMYFGASVSDPHFIGFEGERFFFNGKPDRYYNLLSDSNIQVNAFFRHWASSGEHMLTATQKIGMIINETRIQFDSSKKVLVDGIRLNERPGETVYFKTGNGDHQGSMTVKFKGLEEEYASLGHEEFGKPLKAYVLDVGGYNLHVVMATDESIVNRPYLNFVGQLKSTKVRPHGIVGQTADFDGETRQTVEGSIQGEGIIEGVYSDYEVSDLWANDFKFNRFFRA